jgi:hypothetical protein
VRSIGSPDPTTVEFLTGALNRRELEGVLHLTDPSVRLRVKAQPQVTATGNEQLWRSVDLEGERDFREYLHQLFLALPSLSVTTGAVLTMPGWTKLTAELAGVDRDGLPFEARAHFRLRAVGAKITSINADVVHVATGHDLLSRPKGDPRRYFQTFLEETDATPDPGPDT